MKNAAHISFVFFPLPCGVVSTHSDRLLLYQSCISACATVVDKCQVTFMAPVLVISHIKDTYFFFYCMKMKLELMRWEGHESYSSAPLLALAELFVNPQCGLLNPFPWFCQSPDQHALSSLLIVNTIHFSRVPSSPDLLWSVISPYSQEVRCPGGHRPFS